MTGHIHDLIQKLKILIQYDLETCDAFMDIDDTQNSLDDAKQVAATIHLLSLMSNFSKKYEKEVRNLLTQVEMENLVHAFSNLSLSE